MTFVFLKLTGHPYRDNISWTTLFRIVGFYTVDCSRYTKNDDIGKAAQKLHKSSMSAFRWPGFYFLPLLPTGKGKKSKFDMKHCLSKLMWMKFLC